MLNTLDDIKAAHSGHWFDADNMKFFSSRASSRVYPTPTGTYFVTSEQAGTDAPRRYSVRFADLSGDIVTIGQFQGYTYRSTAHAVAARLAS